MLSRFLGVGASGFGRKGLVGVKRGHWEGEGQGFCGKGLVGVKSVFGKGKVKEFGGEGRLGCRGPV